jgi:hypothetical protein
MLIRFPRDAGLPRMNKAQLKSQTLPTRAAPAIDLLYSWRSIEGFGLNAGVPNYGRPAFRLARARGLVRARKQGEAAARVAQQIALRAKVQVRCK